MSELDAYLQAADRESTVRSYASAIRHYEQEWKDLLPAISDAVARYLVAYASTHAISTLRQRLAALARWHAEQGFADPTRSPLVRKVLNLSDAAMYSTSLISLLRELFRSAGVASSSEYSSHSSRRGFAGWARASGWDLKQLMEYVGWKDVIRTDFSTVASDSHIVPGGTDDIARLQALFPQLEGPTLVFSGSVNGARKFGQATAEARGEFEPKPVLKDAIAWLSANYSPKWGLVTALSRGVGIHHGKLPRSIAQLLVRLFNRGLPPGNY